MQTDEVLNIYKPPGWTPLQAINRLKELKPALAGQSLTYAGRLDPLAEGVLIILSGETIKDKESFLHLPKSYSANILLGVSTDSQDVLGLITETDKSDELDESKLQTAINELIKLPTLPLPIFSSVPVEGRPLFEWALEGKINEIEIPQRKNGITSLILKSTSNTDYETLQKQILGQIDSVSGNFRQDQIKKKWLHFFLENPGKFQTVQLDIKCQSGTYIRSTAQALGTILKTNALLLNLKRTAVGEYKIEDSYRGLLAE